MILFSLVCAVALGADAKQDAKAVDTVGRAEAAELAAKDELEAARRGTVYGFVDGQWRRIFDVKYQRKSGKLIAWVTEDDRMVYKPITGEVRDQRENILLAG